MNWSPGEPNNGANACGYMVNDRDGQWDDAPCDYLLPFACDVPKMPKCPAGTAPNGFACDKCPAGTYAPKDGTKGCADVKCAAGKTDHDKDPATPCVACNLGVGYTDEPGNVGKCKPVQKCAAGKEAVPTRTKNAVCKDCASGTFRSSTMAQFVAKLGAGKACKAWSAECKAVCVDDADTQRGCSTCQNCKRTLLQLAAPDATKDRICLPCQTDAKPGGKGDAWIVHYFQGSNPPGKQCVRVAACRADQEETQQPTMTSDRECATCKYEGATEFKDAGTGKCRATKKCADDEYVSKEPTKTSDRECKPATTCSVDQYEAKPAVKGLTNAVCSSCATCPSTHTETAKCGPTENTQCAGCTTCTASEWLESACSNSAQAVCTACHT